jgi:vacuolar-type H+-ATPase subunit I/STV1
VSLKDWKSLVWQEDEKEPAKPQPVIQKTGNPNVDYQIQREASVIPQAPNPSYDLLLAKTNFDSTDVGVTFHKYYDRLTRIKDEQQRVATALDLAANDGVDRQRVIQAFQQIEARLKSEIQEFNATTDHMREETMVKKGAQVRDNESKIAELQRWNEDLRKEVETAKQKIGKVKGDFDAAVQRRISELHAQKQSFTGE